MIDYNTGLVNGRSPQHAFFHLKRSDPTVGFSYDASTLSGPAFPVKDAQDVTDISCLTSKDSNLKFRLQLGSHLAQHLRHKLDNDQGFTSTVGISTNKLLSKLVGNINKPNGQTTLVPPYEADAVGHSNVQDFVDVHDIGKIPGIGFKTAQRLRAFYLKRPADFDAGLVYGGTREDVTAKDVRSIQGIGTSALRKVLSAPSLPRDMPEKVWGLIHGVDDTDVGMARDVPQQISIEDSYIKLNDLPALTKELITLSRSLISRMRVDLTTSEDILDIARRDTVGVGDFREKDEDNHPHIRRWIAHPRVLRLSTRPRPPRNPDGSRQRSFARISKSGPMPSFVFSLTTEIGVLSRRMVNEAIMPLFRKLHPESAGWDLSLVNLCASGMTTGANSSGGEGRDIFRMFQNQETVLKQWRVSESVESEHENVRPHRMIHGAVTDSFRQDIDDRQRWDVADIGGSEDLMPPSQDSTYMDDEDIEDDMVHTSKEMCMVCGAKMPALALADHDRFHNDAP